MVILWIRTVTGMCWIIICLFAFGGRGPRTQARPLREGSPHPHSQETVDPSSLSPIHHHSPHEQNAIDWTRIFTYRYNVRVIVLPPRIYFWKIIIKYLNSSVTFTTRLAGPQYSIIFALRWLRLINRTSSFRRPKIRVAGCRGKRSDLHIFVPSIVFYFSWSFPSVFLVFVVWTGPDQPETKF